MQNGFLTIVTTVDGTESRFSCKAEMEIKSLSAVLRYSDENATVLIRVDGDGVTIERDGDYSMRLFLQEGKRTVGSLSIAGNTGDVGVETQKIAYSIGKKTFLMQLHYSLIFGEEKQDMRIRLLSSIPLEEE